MGAGGRGLFPRDSISGPSPSDIHCRVGFFLNRNKLQISLTLALEKILATKTAVATGFASDGRTWGGNYSTASTFYPAITDTLSVNTGVTLYIDTPLSAAAVTIAGTGVLTIADGTPGSLTLLPLASAATAFTISAPNSGLLVSTTQGSNTQPAVVSPSVGTVSGTLNTGVGTINAAVVQVSR